MLSVTEIEKIKNEKRLKVNLIYRLKHLPDGWGLIYVKSYDALSEDALLLCEPLDKCKQLLDGCIYTELLH